MQIYAYMRNNAIQECYHVTKVTICRTQQYNKKKYTDILYNYNYGRQPV